ncbi:endo alpha-1,4 polygalactosaminidase [Brevibacterium sp. UCMA 11752]|uniref:endo alpha-1,4 polygalactosaminidase n=1 Tax=Brevibacterium sp. UCMA 11752 TaxID=2745946 RepID=UPI001F367BCC|nr:endo alpha-1,4 polygalactosaminidase [Brevibacterium sp. UCMA 11752]MCF2585992.1 endo alpha-1,4 polygalactosaminidase [Brevibacterium sp. UCMA 11752]
MIGALIAASLAACASNPTRASRSDGTTSAHAVEVPPVGGLPDYQLGGAYEPVERVSIVARDRSVEPAPGRYSICYVNGFQTQPDELETWDSDLLLSRDGKALVDPEWPDEVLIDTSTSDKRERVFDTVSPWIRGCAEAGFDAVEFDNFDSFTRSQKALVMEDNAALASSYVELSHRFGLAVGQKNAAEFSRTLHEEVGFDFAVAEECSAFRECDEYTRVYGQAVIDIEYTDNLPRNWDDICEDSETPASVVLRDRDLTVADNPRHTARHC